MSKINSILNDSTKVLKDYYIKNPKLDAEILLSKVLKKNVKDIILDDSIKISGKQIKLYKDLISRRKFGEPVAYILNDKEFWKYDFYVDRNVLIPRPDTEIIIEETLKIINKDHKKSVLDIGTGSGCIIITLAKERQNLYGSAIDISKKAIKVAKFNAKIHQLTNRINFYNSSVDNFFKGKYDLIISNPPYISKLKIKYLDKDIFCFEPLVSLNGGLSGSLILKKVIKKSSSLMKVGGKLVLEIGYDQKFEIMKLIRKYGFYLNKVIKDYANNDRCVIATKI